MLLIKDRPWDPFEQIGETLSRINVPSHIIEEYRSTYEEFREVEEIVPLYLPQDVKSSEEWYRCLFCEKDWSKPHTEETAPIGEAITEGEPNIGYLSQINLDNIGKDYLCLIYYTQRLTELGKVKPLYHLMSDYFIPEKNIPKWTNLRNTLLKVEAFERYLILNEDIGAISKDSDMNDIIFSDSQRPIKWTIDGESVLASIRYSSHLSKLIRRASVMLQEGNNWEIISHDTKFHEFCPTFKRVILPSGEELGFYMAFIRDVIYSREFHLWDPHRNEILPSIRAISEELNIPYIDLLRLIRAESVEREYYNGLEFISKRVSNVALKSLEKDITKEKKMKG